MPCLIFVWWKLPKIPATGIALLGGLPFIIWELFSLLYYGVPVPNTAYAKLNHGVPTEEFMRQGVYYLLVSFRLDWILIGSLIAGTLLPLIQRNLQKSIISLSIILYIAYLIKIGGDSMVGRFLTPPFFVSVVILVSSIQWKEKVMIALCILVVGISSFSIYSPWRFFENYADKPYYADMNVQDQHSFYVHETTLSVALKNPEKVWPQGHRDRPKPLTTNRVHTTLGGLGFVGYYAGAEAHVIDALALADPLLARLPNSDSLWTSGHLRRDIPAGYLETLQSGINQIEDPKLAEFYDKLTLITRGDLWSWELTSTS